MTKTDTTQNRKEKKRKEKKRSPSDWIFGCPIKRNKSLPRLAMTKGIRRVMLCGGLSLHIRGGRIMIISALQFAQVHFVVY